MNATRHHRTRIHHCHRGCTGCWTQRLVIAACGLSSLVACAGEIGPALDLCPTGGLSDSEIPIARQASSDATTYYVRTDGGDADQCTGRADAAYPGNGSGSGDAQACAWNNPEVALPPTGPLRIAGGDILRIGSGTYLIGDGGFMQAVPSGASPTMPTRILGTSGAPPKLVGTNGIHRVLNLDGSSNVEVGNLEITDQSDCVYKHFSPSVACTSAMAWAKVGLYARASSNVWLHDLNIHGIAARGMNAGGLTNWGMERIKLNKNGSAGWDGNIGAGGSDAGRITIRNIEIGWNGCGERWKTGTTWACWAQQTGGYGDGLGTTDTGGQWLIADAYIHHNTSDGLDLRYMDGADTSKVVLRRIYAVGNAGNQVKVRGNALIENSVLVGYCSYFKNKFFMTESDLCRADGTTLQLVMSGNDTTIVRQNTLVGQGVVQIGHSDGDSTDVIYIRNNLVVGYPYYFRPAKLTAFDGGNTWAAKRFLGNMAWNVRLCPIGTICNQNPRLTNMSLAAFNAKPLAGSPVIGKAGAVPCL